MIAIKLKALKDEKKLTSQQLADLSGVPIGTINRILSGQTENPSFQTVCDLVCSMGGSLDELAGLSVPVGEKPQNLSQEVIRVYEDVLRSKDKWLHRIFICCCALVLFIMGVVAYDLVNPMVGFFRT